MSDAPPGPAAPPPEGRFRWPALLQRCDEALFLLDRRRLIRFVNPAWEALTSVPLAEARLISCRRRRPVAPHEALREVLAHALCPPPEVLQGLPGRSRRPLPATSGGRRWWDVEFFPLRREGQLYAVLGRITLLVGVEPGGPPTPLSDRALTLRDRVAERYGPALLTGESPAMKRVAVQVRLAAR